MISVKCPQCGHEWEDEDDQEPRATRAAEACARVDEMYRAKHDSREHCTKDVWHRFGK